MEKAVNFHGASGLGRTFHKVDPNEAWEQYPGVAIFAAPDAYGWRVIQIVGMIGRSHDVRLVWALHEAERFGASDVFVLYEKDGDKRREIIEDLQMGLNPVICQAQPALALAA